MDVISKVNEMRAAELRVTERVARVLHARGVELREVTHRTVGLSFLDARHEIEYAGTRVVKFGWEAVPSDTTDVVYELVVYVHDDYTLAYDAELAREGT